MGFSIKPKLSTFTSALQHREFLSALRLMPVSEAGPEPEPEYNPVADSMTTTTSTTYYTNRNSTQFSIEPVGVTHRGDSPLSPGPMEALGAPTNSTKNLLKRSYTNARLKELIILMTSNRIQAGSDFHTKVQSGVKGKHLDELDEEKQKNILMQVHQKLKQLIEVKASLRNLRRNKKILLKEKMKLEKQRKTIKRQSTEHSFTTSSSRNSPATSSASSEKKHSYSTIRSHQRTEPSIPEIQHKASPEGEKETVISIPTDIAALPCDEFDMVTIGPNGTKIPKAALHLINWTLKGANVTRKIIMEVFDRETLASHTLTGKPSPAFVGCKKPPKGRLDPLKVADIVHIGTQYFKMTEKEVRQTITTKCADENKMMRQRKRNKKANE